MTAKSVAPGNLPESLWIFGEYSNRSSGRAWSSCSRNEKINLSIWEAELFPWDILRIRCQTATTCCEKSDPTDIATRDEKPPKFLNFLTLRQCGSYADQVAHITIWSRRRKPASCQDGSIVRIRLRYAVPSPFSHSLTNDSRNVISIGDQEGRLSQSGTRSLS